MLELWNGGCLTGGGSIIVTYNVSLPGGLPRLLKLNVISLLP